jgi:hypothetical protein
VFKKQWLIKSGTILIVLSVYFLLGMKPSDLPILHIPTPNQPTQKNYPITYPNPFREQTTIIYNSSVDENLLIKLYSNDGVFLDLIYNDFVEKDVTYRFELDARNLKAGVYYYTLENGNKILQRRIELVR